VNSHTAVTGGSATRARRGSPGSSTDNCAREAFPVKPLAGGDDVLEAESTVRVRAREQARAGITSGRTIIMKTKDPMKRRGAQRKRGMTIIYVLVLMTVLLALASFAVDYGRVQLSRTQLRITTDSAQVGGARREGREEHRRGPRQ